MRSKPHSPHTAPHTAERIRDAAISEFAAHGFAATTVRRIAAVAEVSPGLVIHHFGNKDNLRRACDDHVFESVTEYKRQRAGASPLATVEMFRDDTLRVHLEYLLVSLLDPSDQGQRFFDYYVDTLETIIGEGFAGYRLRPAEDTRAQATALAMLGLAPLLLEPRARRALGTTDPHSSMTRLIPYLSQVYQHGIFERTPTPAATPGSPHDPPTEDPDPASPPPPAEGPP